MIKALKWLLRTSPDIEDQTTHQHFHPHRIRIGEDTLHFEIPHNFSQDVPMSPIPEAIDLNDVEFEGDTVRFKNLWRAWWSFYTPGLFSREIGTLMMSIDVFEVHPAFDRDIFDRENFIEAMQINLVNTYAAFNRKIQVDGETEKEVILPHSPSRYSDRAQKEQIWILHSVVCDQGPDFYIRLNIPISRTQYLGVAFHEINHNSDFGSLYVKTISQYIEWIGSTVYLERKVNELVLRESENIESSHDPDLWPDLWMELHADEINKQLAEGKQINVAHALHAKSSGDIPPGRE